jgi:hypothetical protein
LRRSLNCASRNVIGVIKLWFAEIGGLVIYKADIRNARKIVAGISEGIGILRDLRVDERIILKQNLWAY